MMTKLTDHLRLTGDHGRLPFHSACPVCQDERLAGTLPADTILSPRAGALLAAGVLALSTSGVATSRAQEVEGVATPGGSVDTAEDPDFDPGGDAAMLPDAPQAPAAAGDDAAVEPEPASDPEEPIVDAGDEAPVATVAPSPAAEPPPATPAPTPTVAAATPVATPTPSATPAPAVPTPTGSKPRRRPARHRRSGTRPAAPKPAVPPAPRPAAPPPATAPVIAPPVRPGDRTHLVRPGESLWSIAADMAGDGASPATIARGVHRLWVLNHDRIRTGDPDLLMAGTRLLLRER